MVKKLIFRFLVDTKCNPWNISREETNKIPSQRPAFNNFFYSVHDQSLEIHTYLFKLFFSLQLSFLCSYSSYSLCPTCFINQDLEKNLSIRLNDTQCEGKFHFIYKKKTLKGYKFKNILKPHSYSYLEQIKRQRWREREREVFLKFFLPMLY